MKYNSDKVTQQKIISCLITHKEAFIKKYGIFKMVLFGSYARGEERPESDIDIAIETKLSDYFLLYDFKEVLESYFYHKVDVVRLREQMNESLKKRIMKDGIYV
jgi:predicted nucleotidyltransferase